MKVKRPAIQLLCSCFQQRLLLLPLLLLSSSSQAAITTDFLASEIRELLVDTSEFLMEIEEKCDMEVRGDDLLLLLVLLTSLVLCQSENRHHLTLVSSGMPCLGENMC